MAKHPLDLLQPPSQNDFPSQERIASSYNPLTTFVLPKGEEKHYAQQFADMYFLRLAMLKPDVERIAHDAWKDFELGDNQVKPVDRVLDVRQGELCWVVGTVYMEMPLKPNVLDDISKEHWIVAPPAREKYTSSNGEDQIFLEDESGRLRVTGDQLKKHLLVTGCIIAAMGTENAAGDFEIIDIKLADLPRQPERWERDEADAALDRHKSQKGKPEGGKIAIVSGLSITGDGNDTVALDLLAEFLLGETTTQSETSAISRLIIAGDSLSQASPIPSREEIISKGSGKKYGHETIAFDSVPNEHLDAFIAQLLPSIPVTLMPGASDPSSVAIPQQPLHPALFPHSRAYANLPAQESTEPSWFDSVTNPWEGDIDGWRFLGNSGQPIDDMFKYVEGTNRLRMMEHLLRWRNNAPTAPDTLWSYPFRDSDPFIVQDCPHVYFVGNQPSFATAVIAGPLGQEVRLIAVPKFKEEGILVLLDSETLDVECVKFKIGEGQTR
ncbi:hypothetical protein FKW77_006827 [Venturia effusa]|uniref:DNA-directed DNA polymerase n=1 Tax=Venturia effusa TaxID=50376 RepID=A0A517LB22_9PEZI|nr:hypothetical protein FKW77_006827 [Venturia effusa]